MIIEDSQLIQQTLEEDIKSAVAQSFWSTDDYKDNIKSSEKIHKDSKI